MPITAENKKRYPKNWVEIRTQILNRANHHCEFCGVANYTLGYYNSLSNFTIKKGDEPDDTRFITIELTIAHLDHTPENCHPDNLRALCQRCHNRYDAQHRAQSRKNNRNNTNQLNIF